MAERKSTGGTKEFYYTKQDEKEIVQTETDATKQFKESYTQWLAKKPERKKAAKQKRVIFAISVAALALLVLLILLLFLTKTIPM